IAAAGFPTRVYDADAARARRLEAECGGCAFDDLAAFGEGVDIVVTMLPTGQDVRDVLLGARARTEAGPAIASSSASSSATASATEFGPAPASLAAALREGAVVVDMSSS